VKLNYDKQPKAINFRALAQKNQLKIPESKDTISRRKFDMAAFDSRIWSQIFSASARKFTAFGCLSYHKLPSALDFSLNLRPYMTVVHGGCPARGPHWLSDTAVLDLDLLTWRHIDIQGASQIQVQGGDSVRWDLRESCFATSSTA